MHLKINHVTQYDYDQPVAYALQKIRLRPKASTMQDVVTWELEVEGGKVEASYTDHFGNHVDLVSATQGATSVSVTARGRVETRDTAGILGPVYGVAPLWSFQQPTPLTEPGTRIRALSKLVGESDTVLNGLHALSAAVLKAVPYEVGKTGSATTAEEAATIGYGVCQDHADIFISAARVAGLPARYVSGYLLINEQIDQDASHAWAEVHIDGLGWVGFDVSNGVAPDEKYVRIAIGRDAHDAAPMTGMRVGNAVESLIVSLQVQQ